MLAINSRASEEIISFFSWPRVILSYDNFSYEEVWEWEKPSRLGDSIILWKIDVNKAVTTSYENLYKYING